MTAPPRLQALATTVPDHVLRQPDVAHAAAGLFDMDYSDFGRLAPVYSNAAIETRHSCVPIEWYLAPHDFGERNALYLDNALVLLERAAREALAQAGLGFEAVDMLVTVSSTGIATPGLDARLMERLPFRRDLQRLPVFGLGCAGGVLGLGRAAALARAEPGATVLLLVVELCGLTFRYHDRSKSNVVATALFGDGAAAAVLRTGGEGPQIVAWGEHTWPDSLDVMGWEVGPDGLSVVFSRDIPQLVRQQVREAADRFLAGQNLTVRHLDAVLCHPGGARVVEALEAAFELPPGAMHEARDVLRRFGNMSAPTVLFVLQRALTELPAGAGGLQPGGTARGPWLLSALGPGFTAGFALLRHG